MRTGVMATYPKRAAVAPKAILSIVDQLDRLVVVLNEFKSVPATFPNNSRISYHVSDNDYKDVGKFIGQHARDDYVFTLDDDLLYAQNYADKMISDFHLVPVHRKTVGLHGVIYSDLFDGKSQSRLVYPFFVKDSVYRAVNLLGTGALLTLGKFLPPTNYFNDAEMFVDVRFARFAHETNMVLVSVPREKNWVSQIPTQDSIFLDFSQHVPMRVVKEVWAFGGLSKINTNHIIAIEFLNKANDVELQNATNNNTAHPRSMIYNFSKYFLNEYWSRRKRKLAQSFQKRVNAVFKP